MAPLDQPTPEEVERYAKISEYLNSQSSAHDKILQSVIKIGDEEKARELLQVKYAAEATKSTNELSKELGLRIKNNTMSREMVASILKQNTSERAKNVTLSTGLALAKQKAIVDKQINDLIDKQGSNLEKINKKLKEGKTYRDAAAKMQGMGNIGAGHVTGGIQGGLNTAGEKIGEKVGGEKGLDVGGGIAGIVAAIVIGIMDVTSAAKVAATSMAKANTASGDFAKSFNDINFAKQVEEVGKLQTSTDPFGKTGMNYKQITEKISEMAGAGLKLSPTLSENEDRVLKLNAAALATGQSVGQLSSTLRTLQLTTQNMGNAEDAADDIRKGAQTVARNNIMTTTEYTHALAGLADQLSDLNMSEPGLNQMFKSLLVNVKHLGVTGKVAKDVVGGLIKAMGSMSDESKAFIGVMTGKGGGGYFGAKFGFEQRGAGGDILNRQVDPRKQMQDVMQTIQKLTAGFSGQTKMGMAETFGKQFGLDSKETQALLKGITGNAADQADATKQMADAAAAAEKNARPMADQLADLLQKWVTKPLMAILDALHHPFGGGGNSGKTGIKYIDDAAKERENRVAQITGAKPKPYASGGTIHETGMILAHKNEEVLDAGRAQEYRKNKNSNNGGISVNVNVAMQGNLKAAFDEAYQKALRAVKKSNSYAYGT